MAFAAFDDGQDDLLELRLTPVSELDDGIWLASAQLIEGNDFGNTLPWEEIGDDFSLDLVLPLDKSIEDQLTLEGLIDQGFTWEEGLQLIAMRANIADNPEMGEHPHWQFARWLCSHGYLSEEVA